MNKHTDKPLYAAIVAMTRNHVIGVNGEMPWRYSKDMQRFRELTTSKIGTVIVGRVTWDSLTRKPLPGRRNVVISRSKIDGVECYDNIQEALDACKQGAWIIGGGQIYKMAMPYVSFLDVTIVPDEINGKASVKFPEINSAEWRREKKEPLAGDERLSCERYVRIAD